MKVEIKIPKGWRRLHKKSQWKDGDKVLPLFEWLTVNLDAQYPMLSGPSLAIRRIKKKKP